MTKTQRALVLSICFVLFFALGLFLAKRAERLPREPPDVDSQNRWTD